MPALAQRKTSGRNLRLAALAAPEELRRTVGDVALTPREWDYLAKLDEMTRNRGGVSPTLQEIADAMGVAKASVFDAMRQLKRKGVVRCERHRDRSLRIVPAAEREGTEFGRLRDKCRRLEMATREAARRLEAAAETRGAAPIAMLLRGVAGDLTKAADES